MNADNWPLALTFVGFSALLVALCVAACVSIWRAQKRDLATLACRKVVIDTEAPELDAALGLSLLPPIRVSAAVRERLEAEAQAGGIILQAHVRRVLEQAPAGDVRAVLAEAAATFRRYAVLHHAKGTEDSSAKARVNEAMAAKCEAALAGLA